MDKIELTPIKILMGQSYSANCQESKGGLQGRGEKQILKRLWLYLNETSKISIYIYIFHFNNKIFRYHFNYITSTLKLFYRSLCLSFN